jgi:hypothetical protein
MANRGYDDKNPQRKIDQEDRAYSLIITALTG